MKNLDVLAIGDIVIDAFIRLENASVECEIDKTNCKLCVAFGQKIPYESVEICNAVGNSGNACVSAARLGVASGILTYVGNDQNGKDCVEELKKNNVDTSLVHTVDGQKTNYHYVLWYDVDRTILVKHETFDYQLGDIGSPKWIYLSSLGAHSFDMYQQISRYLESHPEIKLAFQPGVFDMKQGKEKLAFVYSRANAVCVNVEEAQLILGEKSRDLKTLLTGLAALGPKIVFITDGIEGAYAHDTSMPEDFWFMPVYPHTPFERTGAGDAFFSTVVSYLAMGKTVDEALMRGPINSMSVVQQVGAQKGLLSKEKLEEYLANAPVDYKPKKI
jgi:sugar/nucleoside kinase (ribokinase family)